MPSFTPETYFAFIALGFGAGAFGTLIGAGGGFVLTPILLLLFPDQPPERLTSVSLAVVMLNALSGTEAYARMKRIDYRSGLIFAAATIPGAVLGALWTAKVPRRLFDLVFGLVLVGLSAFLMLKKDRAKAPTRVITTTSGSSPGTLCRTAAEAWTTPTACPWP